MTGSRGALLALCFLLLLAGAATAAPAAAHAGEPPDTTGTSVRIFFLSDAHSRHHRVVRFVDEANRDRPDVVLEGGDIVHDGTESEFRRALAERARLEMPWYTVPGNHDLELRGDFDAPPPTFPWLRMVERDDLRIILVDNHAEVFTEEQFHGLEAKLSAAPGRRTVVVMHVPPALGREPLTLRIRHLLPYRLASPVMREPGQVERFTALMERFGVVAVLSGHTHFPDHFVRGGVHYVTTGALGGLTPGFGIANQYTDLVLDGRDVSVGRVPMGAAPREPIGFLLRAFRFYADLNRFNHREEGWTYVPSASVQLRSTVRRIDAGDDSDVVVGGAASFERLLGRAGRQSFLADLGLAAGTGTLAADLELGYRLRPVGDFNRGVFVGGAATANTGLLAGSATAGVGVGLGLGAEWRHVSVEVSRRWATNHRSAAVALGYRY